MSRKEEAADQMSPVIKNIFKSPEWWWRHSVAVMLFAQLWLTQHYVTRKEYEENKKDLSTILTGINTTLVNLNLSIEMLKRDIVQLADHEGRLRTLEQRKP